MISKELLSQIENLDIFSVEFLDKENIIHICGNYKDTEIHTEYSINIHELAFKCKAWALTKEFELHSKLEYDNKGMCNIERFKVHPGMSYREIIKYTYSDSEPEAIFKACEWILEQEEN